MKPIVKWVGGKTQLLPQLLDAINRPFRRYHELFCGGAALFWKLRELGWIPECLDGAVMLGDTNRALINMYLEVAEDPVAVDVELRDLVGRYLDNPQDTYYEVRKAWNFDVLNYDAARFIFLKQTAFNGLWRVNRSGKINMPWGHGQSIAVPNLSALRGYAGALKGVGLSIQDWRENCARIQPDDLVYFDPPYHGTFTGYTADRFEEGGQVSLLQYCQRLDRNGVQVLYTNQASPEMRKMIEDHWPSAVVTEHKARRAINREGSNRQGADLLVRSRNG